MPDNEKGMLYAAFAMIFVGILCFVYVSLATDRPKSSLPASPRRQREDHVSYSKSYRMPPVSPVSPQLEERIRREREFATTSSRESSLYTGPNVPKKPSVVEETEVLEKEEDGYRPVVEPQESPLAISGILYFDQNGKLPFGKAKLEDIELTEEDVRGFRRMGEAELKEENGTMVFHSKHASYSYPARDLEKVVFYDEAFVLVPREWNLPRPVFFTKDLEEMKQFLSQIPA